MHSNIAWQHRGNDLGDGKNVKYDPKCANVQRGEIDNPQRNYLLKLYKDFPR